MAANCTVGRKGAIGLTMVEWVGGWVGGWVACLYNPAGIDQLRTAVECVDVLS